MSTDRTVATQETLGNDELFFLVEVHFAPDKIDKEAWVAHAARLHEHVQEIGGYDKVYPRTINAFAYICPDRAVKEKLFDGVMRDYAKILGNKEHLAAEEHRIVSYLTLVSMTNPAKTEAVIVDIKAAYTAHGLEIPAKVAMKMAEREKVAANHAKRELEQKAHAFRHPYLHKGMSFTEKAETLRALGYRLETRDINGSLKFVGRDPITQELVRQTVFGERTEYGSLRQGKPETAVERARRESERNARRDARSANPNKGANGGKKKEDGDSAKAFGRKK